MAVVGLGFNLRLSVTLCISLFPHDVSKNDVATWHTNVPRWVLESHLFWGQKVKVTSAGVGHSALVSAGFSSCSVHRGRSSTLGHCSRRCHTCCVSATAATRRSASPTSGWQSSACLLVPPSTHCSSASRPRWYRRSTLPSASTPKR